jgi:Flp pilus assembly protein TadG
VSRRVATLREEPERGASVVEFAFVAIPLLLLLMGIVYFGMLLSFKQAVTQAAAEGARADAVLSGSSTPAATVSSIMASAANHPMGSWNKVCNSGSLTCTATTAPCTGNTSATCVTVTVTYNYSSSPLLPSLPLVSSFMPSTIKSVAVVQMNP